MQYLIGPIINKEAFRGFVFIFNTAWSWKGSAIDFGIFSQSANAVKAYNKIECGINPFLKSAKRYNVFLFI